ncbi:MAG TPA: ABC transporter permease [Gallionellaceae bacterium]|nr:ABC transporter permease [Gallionellaceae bacterium]
MNIIKELFIVMLLLLGVSFVVFGILYAAPGDQFSVLLEGQLPTAQARQEIREAMGGAQGWYGQYFSWLLNVLSGNFGTSVRTGLPVAGELLTVSLNTLYLTLGSMLVTLLVAVPIALYSSVRGHSVAISWPLTMLGYVISALPVFWLGYIAIYISIHGFDFFPLASMSRTPGENDWLYTLVPVLVLGLGSGTISEVIRNLREEMSRVMAEDYVRTARAKGASVWRHAFKEGLLLPVTQIIAAKIPFILGGAVIVEQVFNWPGMGRMAWQAAQDRDFPVIMGIVLVAAAFVRLGSLIQHIVCTAVNPQGARD